MFSILCFVPRPAFGAPPAKRNRDGLGLIVLKGRALRRRQYSRRAKSAALPRL
jgi:hypothetical protein